MRFSKSWIDEWVDTGISADQLSDIITMAGLEVDTVEKVAGDFDHVVVGLVAECADHPNSDHLHVTKVDIGNGDLLDIVCGAPNCRKGLKVCVSLVGAHLPGGLEIKPTKLRGEPSNGMLCSFKELGVDLPSNGIIELPEDAPLGMDIREYFGWNDSSVEVDLTANRADCLSIIGLAREISVLTGKPYKMPEFTRAKATLSDTFPINIHDFKACPKYYGRVFRGLNVKAQTPMWMQEKLRRCGLRSVDPIVDVTNYVMLELGQPLHSFDLDKLKGSLNIRFANEGEKMVLLSGQEAALTPDTLIIADENGPQAMAGIYGGINSGVSETTANVLLECAYFAPDAIKGRAREYGLATDASHRFERGIDYNIQELACERATQLLLDICGGEAGEIIRVESADNLPKPKSISLSMKLVNRVIGNNIVNADQVFKILNDLGIETRKVADDQFESVSPSWRIDIEIAEDLIEEVARIYGYNNIPNLPPQAGLRMIKSSMTDLPLDRIKSTLVNRDYNEVVTYSFVQEDKMKVAFPDVAPIIVPKPITAEMNAMRVSLLPGLLDVVAYNNSRQQNRVRIFESGLKFIPEQGAEFGIRQVPVLAGAVSGLANDEQWAVSNRNVDFYDIKGDLEAVLGLTQQSERFSFVPCNIPALHPGQSARILLDGNEVGFIGLVHPTVQKAYGVKFKTFIFEIEQSAILKTLIPEYKPLSKFQANRRDIAVLVDKNIPAADIINEIKVVNCHQISKVCLFDLYEGDNIDMAKKSLAISMILQDNNKTLEDSEINALVDKVVDTLKNKFGAALRD